ncbi:hypothetical protein D3C80_1244050 [compost metagenome]
MADEQQRLVGAIGQQAGLLLSAEGLGGHFVGQRIRLENDVAVGLRFAVLLPELGAEERAGVAIAAGQGDPLRQAHIGAPQQPIADLIGEAAGFGGGLEERLVDPPIGELPAQRVDQVAIPAGVDHAEAPGIEEQRHFLEPAEEIVPVGRMPLELLQGFANQPCMPRRVLADIGTAAARRRRSGPAERVEFVVTHDAQGLARGDHVVHPVQRLADARAAVDDIAEEQRLPAWMSPYPAVQPITEGFQQPVEGVGAAVHIADQVITARGIELAHSLPPRRLPHPSLVRQTS